MKAERPTLSYKMYRSFTEHNWSTEEHLERGRSNKILYLFTWNLARLMLFYITKRKMLRYIVAKIRAM